MNEKPTPLRTVKLEPVESVVDTLKYWLAQAKTGKLRGVILLGVTERGSHLRSSKGEMGDANAVYLCQLVMADAVVDARNRESDFELPELDEDDDESS